VNSGKKPEEILRNLQNFRRKNNLLRRRGNSARKMMTQANILPGLKDYKLSNCLIKRPSCFCRGRDIALLLRLDRSHNQNFCLNFVQRKALCC
jgi:hypothetical protein